MDIVDRLRAIDREATAFEGSGYEIEAADEIERLRRERDDLIAFLAGIGRQAAEMAKLYADKKA